MLKGKFSSNFVLLYTFIVISSNLISFSRVVESFFSMILLKIKLNVFFFVVDDNDDDDGRLKSF